MYNEVFFRIFLALDLEFYNCLFINSLGSFRLEIVNVRDCDRLVGGCGTFLLYTPYKGLNLANQKGRKSGVFGRQLDGSHSLFYCYFEKWNNDTHIPESHTFFFVDMN